MDNSHGHAITTFDSHRQAITTFDPGPDDESQGIPRVSVNGWIKVTHWNGKVKVFKVRSVRIFESVMAEQLYPPRPKGYPLYDDMFPRGRLEVIPEAEALAWLAEHGMQVPGESESAPGEEG